MGMKPWTDVYAPRTSQDIMGQHAPIATLKTCIISKQPVLLAGPPGCGKTSAIHALGRELGYEVFEINPSDARDKDHIQQLVGGAAGQCSLFSKGKIVLIDEVDNIAGQQDRGGIAALCDMLDRYSSQQSFLLIANDPWERKIATIRKRCKMVEFARVDTAAVFNMLQRICHQESVQADEDALRTLARRSNGDARAAIMDLEMLSRGSRRLEKEMLIAADDRERQQSMFQGLQLVFQGRSIASSLHAFDAVDAETDECMLWVEENVGRIYTGHALQNALNCLSKADIFLARIRRWQHWRFLVYSNALLSAGVSLAKAEPLRGFIRFQQSSRLLQIYIAKQRRVKKMAAMEKLSEHDSYSKLAANTFPYLKRILKNAKPGLLSEEELEDLRK